MLEGVKHLIFSDYKLMVVSIIVAVVLSNDTVDRAGDRLKQFVCFYIAFLDEMVVHFQAYVGIAKLRTILWVIVKDWKKGWSSYWYLVVQLLHC